MSGRAKCVLHVPRGGVEPLPLSRPAPADIVGLPGQGMLLSVEPVGPDSASPSHGVAAYPTFSPRKGRNRATTFTSSTQAFCFDSTLNLASEPRSAEGATRRPGDVAVTLGGVLAARPGHPFGRAPGHRCPVRSSILLVLRRAPLFLPDRTLSGCFPRLASVDLVRSLWLCAPAVCLLQE